jgi:hypothetical protein
MTGKGLIGPQGKASRTAAIFFGIWRGLSRALGFHRAAQQFTSGA